MMLQRRDFGLAAVLEGASGKEFRPKLYRAEREVFKYDAVRRCVVHLQFMHTSTQFIPGFRSETELG